MPVSEMLNITRRWVRTENLYTENHALSQSDDQQKPTLRRHIVEPLRST